MGHHSPIHEWDMRRRSLFLPTPPWAREDDISPRVLHKHLLFHIQDRETRVWVEIRDRAHRPGLQGPRGVSTSLHHRLADQSVIQGMFMLSRLWARVLIDSSASHSFIIASCVKELDLEVETLEKPLRVSSLLGTKVSVDLIYQDCELAISGIIFTVDLRVMDMSEFDVILGMDWLTTH